MIAFPLAWRMLRRDWRAGELQLLGLALVLAVAALTAVSVFADRLSRMLELEAAQLLGGDALLTSDHPIPPPLLEQARAEGLAALQSWSFTSMVAVGDNNQLAGVKAVESGYPLRGGLRVSDGPGTPERPAQAPAVGEVWLDERLAGVLGARPGAEVVVGYSRLRVGAVLTFEPDRGANFFALVPRLMMNLADLPATGLVQPGSRIWYRLHLAGAEPAVQRYREWAKARLARGEGLEDVRNARPEVRSALDRAQRFLRLAALMAMVLAGVAVGLAARRYMERHLDGCAVMRCLGATRRQVLGVLGLEFLCFGGLAGALGVGVGYGLHGALVAMLAELVNGSLPAPSLVPALQGLSAGLVLLAGFVLPQLLRLGRVSTVRVLRREWGGTERSGGLAAGLAVLTLGALAIWLAADIKLGAAVALGFLALGAAYALVGAGLLRLLAGLRAGGGSGWRLGIAALVRRRGLSVLQMVALAVGVTALMLLTVLRDDLLAHWRQSMPADAPNRFIVNIQPEQREGVARHLAALPGPPQLLPMVRGRLSALNGTPVVPEAYREERAQRLVEREFNLSWSDQLPGGNLVLQGRWHGPEGEGFSVEQGLAQTLGIRLGDALSFDIGGETVVARVSSLRKLEWDSMRVNFFVIAPPRLLSTYPASYITAFHLPEGESPRMAELLRQYPNLTVIDTAAMIDQFRAVLEQLGRAVQFVFLFALVAGALVMAAALQATHDERCRELAILRVLGARDRQLRQAVVAEFLALGGAAGVLGAAGASLMGWLLARLVFDLGYLPPLWPLLAGLLAGAAGCAVLGYWGTAGARRRPVLPALRGTAG